MSLADLQKAVAIIDQMTKQYGLIRSARDLPGEYAREVARVRLGLSYVGDLSKPRLEKLGAQALELITAQETLRGEMERDALLRKYAAELESLRAALPSLAAAAAIELGVIARALAEEAKGESK